MGDLNDIINSDKDYIETSYVLFDFSIIFQHY